MNRKRQIARILATVLIIYLAIPSVFPGIETRPSPPRQKPPAVDLGSLLDKTAEYCRKLESAVLYFVCREEISEKIDPALDNPPPPRKNWSIADTGPGNESRGAIAIIPAAPKIKNSYVYDYQCVRKDGEIQEVRMLLEENRKKRNEQNAVLKTSVLRYGNVMLGPVGIFGKSCQADYDYAIVGSATFEKKPVIIVEAKPKADATEAKVLYGGKAWIDPVTGDIMKIEYCEQRIGHYEVVDQRGKKYSRTPRLTLRTEFSAEKNGLRFPSKLFVEEAYLNKGSRVFVRSETSVVYKDFKFFTVEVDIK